MKILLLEDDETLGALLKEHLSKNALVVWAKSLVEAVNHSGSQKFALMLLDVNLPDVKKGFEIGCDDYIKKTVRL